MTLERSSAEVVIEVVVFCYAEVNMISCHIPAPAHITIAFPAHCPSITPRPPRHGLLLRVGQRKIERPLAVCRTSREAAIVAIWCNGQ